MELQHEEKVISYLIEWDTYNILIDTGMGVVDIKKYIENISNKKIIVINTHHHFDHIGDNHQFDDIFAIDHEKMIHQQRGYTNKELRAYFSPDSFTECIWFDFNLYHIKPFQITKFLNNWSIIDCHPFEFHIIHTPWHSKDSLCLFEKNNGYLFCWDTYYEWNIYIDNIQDYLLSLEKLIQLPLRKIFPWHNSTWMNGDNMKEFIHFIIAQKKDLIKEWSLRYKNNTIFLKPDLL